MTFTSRAFNAATLHEFKVKKKHLRACHNCLQLAIIFVQYSLYDAT